MIEISKVQISDLSSVRTINEKAIPAVNSVSEEEFIGFMRNLSILEKQY